MTDLNPAVQQNAQLTIQEIVDRLATTHRGEDRDAVRAALAQGLADAGIPEQPEKWVTDTANEIAVGRTIVVDRGRRDEDDPARG
ncbi:MAG TPA: hypothetical protein VE781_00445 [Kineosporiaceae bacterium]|jgi:hypothetical protein|nr:hypothetical protein [Kineosporiaceae bacterium]